MVAFLERDAVLATEAGCNQMGGVLPGPAPAGILTAQAARIAPVDQARAVEDRDRELEHRRPRERAPVRLRLTQPTDKRVDIGRVDVGERGGAFSEPLRILGDQLAQLAAEAFAIRCPPAVLGRLPLAQEGDDVVGAHRRQLVAGER